MNQDKLVTVHSDYRGNFINTNYEERGHGDPYHLRTNANYNHYV